jgi:molybdopterin converting factor small subunit
MKLKVPLDDVQLIFINGIKAGLSTSLNGGERVGVFPPIGGG